MGLWGRGACNPYEINFPSILSRPGFLHGRLDRSRTLHRPSSSSSAHSFPHSLRHLLQHDDLLLDQSIYLPIVDPQTTRQAAILGPYPRQGVVDDMNPCIHDRPGGCDRQRSTAQRGGRSPRSNSMDICRFPRIPAGEERKHTQTHVVYCVPMPSVASVCAPQANFPAGTPRGSARKGRQRLV